MTDYVDSMKVEGVLYEIHDTQGRIDLSKKVNKSDSLPDTFTLGVDSSTDELYWEIT